MRKIGFKAHCEYFFLDLCEETGMVNDYCYKALIFVVYKMVEYHLPFIVISREFIVLSLPLWNNMFSDVN